jgi:uncharacterized protein (TIGR03086 family)
MDQYKGMRTVEALAAALDASAGFVGRITTANLRLPTSNPGWSVRDVIGHSIAVTLKFASFANETTDRPRTPDEDPVGFDHETAFRAAATVAKTAWACADPARICHLPFGSFPAELAAGINLFDLLAHTWDIEAATREIFTCPDDIWATALQAARQVIGEYRDPRHYALELPPGPNPTVRSQFLSYLGRDAGLTARTSNTASGASSRHH